MTLSTVVVRSPYAELGAPIGSSKRPRSITHDGSHSLGVTKRGAGAANYVASDADTSIDVQPTRDEPTMTRSESGDGSSPAPQRKRGLSLSVLFSPMLRLFTNNNESRGIAKSSGSSASREGEEDSDATDVTVPMDRRASSFEDAAPAPISTCGERRPSCCVVVEATTCSSEPTLTSQQHEDNSFMTQASRPMAPAFEAAGLAAAASAAAASAAARAQKAAEVATAAVAATEIVAKAEQENEGRQSDEAAAAASAAAVAAAAEAAVAAAAEASAEAESQLIPEAFNPFLFIKRLPPYDMVGGSRAAVLPSEPRFPGRKTLVLDLDETLVHCTVEAVDSPDVVLPVCFNGVEYRVCVRKRPYLDAFLAAVAPLFEVVVFTASQRVYADALLDTIDPEGALVHHRLFREACLAVDGNYLKDLNILGRDLSSVILVDNSPHCYGYQLDNGVPIRSWYEDRDDDELLKLLEFLQQLAREPGDIRPLLREQFRTHVLVAEAG